MSHCLSTAKVTSAVNWKISKSEALAWREGVEIDLKSIAGIHKVYPLRVVNIFEKGQTMGHI